MSEEDQTRKMPEWLQRIISSPDPEAKAAYRKAIELNPNYATAFNNLGNLVAKDAQHYPEDREALHEEIERTLDSEKVRGEITDPKLLSQLRQLRVVLAAAIQRAKELEDLGTSSDFSEALIALRVVAEAEKEDLIPFEGYLKLLRRIQQITAMSENPLRVITNPPDDLHNHHPSVFLSGQEPGKKSTSHIRSANP